MINKLHFFKIFQLNNSTGRFPQLFSQKKYIYNNLQISNITEI